MQNLNVLDTTVFPWRYICNGRWDCPNGYDEYECTTSRICRNMFKCKDSMICLHINDICDGYEDCPIKDDEILCALKDVHCVKGCSCLNFAIACTNVTSGFENIGQLPQVSIFITHSNISNMNFILPNNNLIILNCSHNAVSTIKNAVLYKTQLFIIDLSFNKNTLSF